MTDQTTNRSALREQLLDALDFPYCQGLGYATPEGLLAAYEASRTQAADRAALREIAAQAIRDAACTGDCGQTEEECRAERIQPFVWRHGVLAVVEGSPEQLAAAVLAAVLPAPVDRAALVRAAASFVRDTYSGEWADDAAATLETDADKIERGEPCSLLRLAAVLPATTDPTAEGAQLATDYAEERAERKVVQGKLDRARDELKRLRVGRAAVLREEADRVDATRAGFPIAVQNGITWATAELRRHAAELRRVADETAATETPDEAWQREWDRRPDGADVSDLFEITAVVPCSGTLFSAHPPHTWEPQPGVPAVHCPGERQPAAGARQDGAQR